MYIQTDATQRLNEIFQITHMPYGCAYPLSAIEQGYNDVLLYNWHEGRLLTNMPQASIRHLTTVFRKMGLAIRHEIYHANEKYSETVGADFVQEAPFANIREQHLVPLGQSQPCQVVHGGHLRVMRGECPRAMNENALKTVTLSNIDVPYVEASRERLEAVLRLHAF